MSILHPLAKHYNTPENYEKLKRLNNAHENIIDIKFDKKELEKTIDNAMKDIVRKINK